MGPYTIYYSVACFLALTIYVNTPLKSINIQVHHIYGRFSGISGDACLGGLVWDLSPPLQLALSSKPYPWVRPELGVHL